MTDSSRSQRALLTEHALLVLAFATMAVSVAADHGHYSVRALLWLGASLVFLIGAARRYGTGPTTPVVPLETSLAAALIGLLLVGLLDRPGMFLQTESYRPAYETIQVGLAVVVAAGFLRPRGNARVRAAIFVVGLLLGLGLRVGMVVASPGPQIDVFPQFQESAAHLLQGLNPFTTAITPPPAGAATFGYHVTGYAYPPAGLYAETLFYWCFGDIRYAHIAAELVAVACLYAIVPSSRRAAAQLLGLLFWFHPRGFFVIEQAWNEPLLVGSAGLFLCLAVTRPESRWVAVVFGVFLSLKQYLVFFAALFFLRPRRWRWLPLAGAVVLLTWLPFLLWDAPSAVHNGLLFQFRTPFRPDGLTVATAVFRAGGWTATKWVAIGVGLIVGAFTQARLNRRTLGGWLHASVLTTLAVFLCGSQAFCNYYYFLGAMLLFLIALRLREEAADAS